MMDARRWQSPAAAAAAAEAAEEDSFGCAGAGGPSRRPPRRGLHRASPYGLGPRRWLPKLPVASRIFPATSRDLAASENNDEEQRESLEVIHESHSAEPNTSAEASGLSTSENHRFNLLLEGDRRNPSDGVGLAEIKKMIKQRNFSRDETERLIEIMQSRTPDLSFEDQRAPGSTAKGFEATAFAETLLTPSKPTDPQSSWGTDISAPSNVPDVGSSPIEIAKAYMEAQNSAYVQESQKRKFRALSHGVEIDNSSSEVFPKVAMESPVCWPGSVVRDYPNYLTPKSNKGRTLPQALSRTPYSGSVFRRSIKNTRHSNAYNNSSGQPQLSTPFSVGSKAILEDKMTSASGFRLQPLSSSRGGQTQTNTFGATTPFFPREGSAPPRNVTFSLEGPLRKGTTESISTCGHVSNMSGVASVPVHPKSSETAFKILQHLEKAIPSPTAKSVGLRQTPVKRTAASVVTNSQFKEPDNISSGHRNSSTSERDGSYQEISDAKKAPPSSCTTAEELSTKTQDSRANSEVPEMRSSKHPSGSDLTSTSAAGVVNNNSGKVFTFTFPVATASNSLPEPPPTPTLGSPPARNLPAIAEDIPKFTFGSSSTTNSLVFSLNSTSSVNADETVPSFKFGSDKKREFCFDIASKNAVCL
ncbi:hypothetical protein ACP70R_043324 [Stipagrostis hirtigluma subsp. patula]